LIAALCKNVCSRRRNRLCLDTMETMYKMKASLYLISGLVAAAAFLNQPAACAGKPSYDSKMQLGQSLQFNGNLEQAIKAYKYAASLKPNAFDPHFLLVNIYAQQQDFKAAAEECRVALRIKPGNRDLHLLLGNLDRTLAGNTADPAEQKQLLAEAVKELEAAEECGASPALVQSTLAVLHVQTGNFDKAMEHVDKALDKNDKQPDAHLIRGILKYKKGDKQEAMKELDIAVQQKGKNAEARNTKADILFADGKSDEALDEYKRALEDDPKYLQSMAGIANIYMQRQKWDEALTWYEKAQEARPGDATVIYSVAICLEKMGKVDMAIKKFQEGMLADPNRETSAQIRSHVQELQQKQLFSVPGLNVPGGSAVGPGTPGSELFGPGSSFFNQSFKDMIKIQTPGENEDKKEKKEKSK
jgi:tetratricopeptide (TPR) repeat protein